MFNPFTIVTSIGKQLLGIGFFIGAVAGAHDQPELLDVSELVAEEASDPGSGLGELYLDAMLHLIETVAEPAATFAFNTTQGLPPTLVHAAALVGLLGYAGHKLWRGPPEGGS